jgi:hypothetical protein
VNSKSEAQIVGLGKFGPWALGQQLGQPILTFSFISSSGPSPFLSLSFHFIFFFFLARPHEVFFPDFFLFDFFISSLVSSASSSSIFYSCLLQNWRNSWFMVAEMVAAMGYGRQRWWFANDRVEARASWCDATARLGCAEGLRQWGDAGAGGAEHGRVLGWEIMASGSSHWSFLHFCSFYFFLLLIRDLDGDMVAGSARLLGS